MWRNLSGVGTRDCLARDAYYPDTRSSETTGKARTTCTSAKINKGDGLIVTYLNTEVTSVDIVSQEKILRVSRLATHVK